MMKTLLVFILSLSLLVFGKPKHVHANSDLYKLAYSSTATSHQEANRFSITQKIFIIQNAHLDDKNELLTTIEDEEEDVVFSKKQLTEAKSTIALNYETSFLLTYYSPLPTSLISFKQFAHQFYYKYIFHRALRL